MEEMQYVAAEMQKDEHFRVKKIPLLIGGATTSRVHTAVKIAPHYEGSVVYMPDASRSVGVAQNLWGYAKDEQLSNQALIAEQYQGIRPAPGYPACPDHSAKTDMFALLQCSDIDMSLTESLAMNPAASVSGFYIGHPDSVYFSVGKIGEDQLQDLAQRRGMELEGLRRLLAPNLG